MAVQTGRFTLYNAGTPLRLSYETAETNYADFSISSGGDLTIAPTGGDTNVTGNLAVSGGLTLGTNLPYSELNLGGNIVNADISATAEIAVSKLADGSARQLLQTDAAGTGVEWTSNVDVPGTLDVTGATVLDSTLTVSGDANFDSGTLFVDVSTDEVVVGPEYSTNGRAKFSVETDESATHDALTIKSFSEDRTSGVESLLSWRFEASGGYARRAAYIAAGKSNTWNVTANRSSYLSFGTTNSNVESERMRITSDGYLRMASGSGGIQFNGDTAAANALDDYEEGTWTPTYGGSVSDPTCTHDFQNGKYTKIGNIVHVSCGIGTDAASGGSGDLRINGLPFTSAADSWASSSNGVNYDFSSAVNPNAYISPSTNFIEFVTDDNTAGVTSVSVLQNGTNDNRLFFSITYTAA